MSERVVAASADGCLRAVEVIKSGGLVAIPTDTFYGLAVDPFQPKALQRLCDLKTRQGNKPIPLLVHKLAMAQSYTQGFSAEALRLAREWWPGPLTLVLPASEALPPAITGGGSTVGLRIANSPFLAQLLARLGGPITGTSANRAAEPPARSYTGVELAVGKEVDLVVDGGLTPGGPASTVVDCSVSPPKVLREGPIPEAHIHQLLEALA